MFYFQSNFHFILILQCNAPDPSKIPKEEPILGVTAVLLTCSFYEQEFLRIGYYVNNELEGLIKKEAKKEEKEKKDEKKKKEDNEEKKDEEEMDEESESDENGEEQVEEDNEEEIFIPREKLDLKKVKRYITKNPKITLFDINWEIKK